MGTPTSPRRYLRQAVLTVYLLACLSVGLCTRLSIRRSIRHFALCQSFGFHLAVCLFDSLLECLLVCLSICLCLFACLLACVSVLVFVCVLVCTGQFVLLHVCLDTGLTVYFCVCKSACLAVSPACNGMSRGADSQQFNYLEVYKHWLGFLHRVASAYDQAEWTSQRTEMIAEAAEWFEDHKNITVSAVARPIFSKFRQGRLAADEKAREVAPGAGGKRNFWRRWKPVPKQFGEAASPADLPIPAVAECSG